MRFDPPLIVALTGVLALFLGQITNHRGQKKKAEQESAANELQEREQQWEERGEIIKDLRVEVNRVNDARRREQHEGDAQLAREQMRHETEMKRVHRECVESRGHLRDALMTMVNVVNSEVARTAAQEVLDEDVGHDSSHPKEIEP